jgi:outer membrane protein TolC
MATNGIKIYLLLQKGTRKKQRSNERQKMMRQSRTVWGSVAVPLSAFFVMLACTAMAVGQGASEATSYSGSSGSSTQSMPASSSGASLGTGLPSGGMQSPFSGSVPEGKASGTVLSLSFSDALDRGLRNNLGALLQSDNLLAARGQRWSELSHLLPNVSSSISENLAQINLAAEGINFPGVKPIIGPYGYFDARVYLTQDLFNYEDLLRDRGARENETAARYTYKNARDLVTLAVGNAYLQALAGVARVDTAQAQVTTAQALSDRTADQLKAGLTPAIDSLRAQVELQSRQQQLIVARNNYSKEKLALARVIGLPSGQEFELTDLAPYKPLVPQSLDEYLQRAYAMRSDYQAALQQVRAAQNFRNAATAEHYPTLSFAGNYGDIGLNPGNSHGSFQVSGSLNIPIFQGGKAHADVLQAEARLRQSQQQFDNLRGQIDYEVRTALLDLNAANDQVQVARSSVDLANQALTQARDRFSAGVTDNLEVVQAQEAVAQANENYISSLYAHNLAKVELARAIGFAEQGVRQYLKSK